MVSCPSCPSCRGCVPATRRYWDRCTSSTYGVKFCSILIMLKCAFIALTGRGVLSILQAIVGVIFAIEGFWGAVRFDRPSIKRFLIFIACDAITGLIISILNLDTVNQYCSTATDPGSSSTCMTTATLYAYLLLALSVGVLPVFFIITTLFYMKLLAVHESQIERGKQTQLHVFPNSPLFNASYNRGHFDNDDQDVDDESDADEMDGDRQLDRDKDEEEEEEKQLPPGVRSHPYDEDTQDEGAVGYPGTIIREGRDPVAQAQIRGTLARDRRERQLRDRHVQREQQQHPHIEPEPEDDYADADADGDGYPEMDGGSDNDTAGSATQEHNEEQESKYDKASRS